MTADTRSRICLNCGSDGCAIVGSRIRPNGQRLTRFRCGTCGAAFSDTPQAVRFQWESEREFLHRFVVVSDVGCWEWQGYISTQGYGTVGARTYVHRWAYEMYRGPIPHGLEIDHLCRNTKCCNPEHLEAVTQRENWLRGYSPIALAAGKTHCLQGHPYDDANTYIRKDGKGRLCRTCRREGMARIWAARRSAA